MALKAGLVGVNPKGVDKNGMPIASGGSADAYTKAETNTLLDGKVSNSQLTANNKAFHFAYDSTSEKYGYKLDGTGDFIPFESAGGGQGWVKPANLTHSTLVFPEGSAYIDGGYYVDDEAGICYIDLLCSKLGASGSVTVTGFPAGKGVKVLAYRSSTELATDDAYITGFSSVDSFDKTSGGDLSLSSWSALGYMRVIGMYPTT